MKHIEPADARACASRTAEPARSFTERREWDVSGLSCAADAARLERRLRRVDGVLEAVVNPITERAYVAIDPQRLNDEGLRAAVEDAGYGVR